MIRVIAIPLITVGIRRLRIPAYRIISDWFLVCALMKCVSVSTDLDIDETGMRPDRTDMGI